MTKRNLLVSLLVVSTTLTACYGGMGYPPPPPPADVPPLPELSSLQEPPVEGFQTVEMLDLEELPPIPDRPNYDHEIANLPAVATPRPELGVLPPVVDTEAELPFETTERMARLDAARLENAVETTPEPIAEVAPELLVTPREPGGEIIDVSPGDPIMDEIAPTLEVRVQEAIAEVEVAADPLLEERAQEPTISLEAAGLAPQPARIVPAVEPTPPPAPVPPRPRLQLDPLRILPSDDEGIIVAATDIQPGQAAQRVLPDCAGAGTIVQIETAQGTEEQILDIDGTPCQPANVLFDGHSPVGQRAADPSIDISVHASINRPQPAEPPAFIGQVQAVQPQGVEDFATTPPNFLPRTIQADAVDASLEPPGPLTQDQLVQMESLAEQPTMRLPSHGRLEATIKQWQAEEQAVDPSLEEIALAEALQADLADIREQAASRLAQDYEQQLEDYASQLRQAEVERDLVSRRHQQVMDRLEQGLQRNEAERQQWRQEERRLREESQSLTAQITNLSVQHERLKNTFGQREQAYLSKIAKLERDLAAAEAKANQARQELVVKAAEKIAEAERLAFAARMAERDQLERRAARLQLEGSTLMQRAQDINDGRQVLVPGLTGQFGAEAFPPITQIDNEPQQPTEPALPPFEALPVQLEARDMALSAVFDQVFGQLGAAIGDWRVAWELEGVNHTIKDDQWTVTAETTLGEFLRYVQARVAEAHDVQLSYQRFDKTRLFVISD